MLLSTSWGGLGAAVSSLSPFAAFLLSCLLGIYLIFLIDLHTESLVQANRATLQRRWDWGQNPSYANKAGAAFPVDPLCGFLLAPGKASSLLTGAQSLKKACPLLNSTPLGKLPVCLALSTCPPLSQNQRSSNVRYLPTFLGLMGLQCPPEES